jgi:hypothetical protein
MSGANLAAYAVVALVLFLVVFVAVAVDLFRGKQRYPEAARLPLESDSPEGSDHV